MNNKKINNSSAMSFENNKGSNEELYVVTYETACSPEFSEGCLVIEDEA